MPAEAIHLSALEDSFKGPGLALRLAAGVEDRERASMLRVGAVLIDLAYFDRFALGVLRYLLGRPLATSPIGDQLHQITPVRLCKLILRRAALLRAQPSTRKDGGRLLAVGLGYLSHIAVDSSLHPLVNQLAGVRAKRLGDRPARQHNEVEKFHSILFHEERLGYDFMGDARLVAHITVDGDVIRGGGAIAVAFRDALVTVHSAAPPDRVLARWIRGYAQYTQLLASRFGKRLMPQAVKDEVRGEVYDAPYGRFVDHYARAVLRSRSYLEAGLAFAADGDSDDAFDRVVPEGSIDDPPYATDLDRGLAS